MSPTRVLLVDDHPVVRNGIRNMLDKAVGIEVIGEASDGEEALRLAIELEPDVMLLDMELPGLPGNEVAEKLLDTGSTTRILALSAYDDKHYIQELLSNGASGYLVKDEIPDTIIEAIRGVARGEDGWVSRKVAARMSTWMKEEDETPLTSREVQVLRGVVSGKTNQEIAQDLNISEKTVEKHLDGIFSKLEVTSRTEAAVHAVREGWL